MKILWWHSCILSCPFDLGNYKAHLRCSQWAGSCVKCSSQRTWTQGIFCANFYWSVGNFRPCQQMWCGECYIIGTTHLFHVASPVIHGGQEGNEKETLETRERLQGLWKGKVRDPLDFLRARDGEHLMTPFECDLCIFRKLRKVEPSLDNSQDELLMTCIRRINLDAFRARASNTVNQNRRQVNASLKFSKLLGLAGSFDHCGYEVA